MTKQEIDVYYDCDWLFNTPEEKPIDTYIIGHLSIERTINAILNLLLKNKPEIKIKEMNFYKKIQALYMLDILSSKDYNILNKFNQYRNKLAHENDFKLTVEDLKSLAKDIEETIFFEQFDIDNCLQYDDVQDIFGILTDIIGAIQHTLVDVCVKLNKREMIIKA
ncbi:MAG: hypothetical protein WCY19_02670 [Candidatus Gastranaerophilaceae bacterium]